MWMDDVKCCHHHRGYWMQVKARSGGPFFIKPGCHATVFPCVFWADEKDMRTGLHVASISLRSE